MDSCNLCHVCHDFQIQRLYEPIRKRVRNSKPIASTVGGFSASTSITETSSPCSRPQEKVANYAKAYGSKVQFRWV